MIRNLMRKLSKESKMFIAVITLYLFLYVWIDIVMFVAGKVLGM